MKKIPQVSEILPLKQGLKHKLIGFFTKSTSVSEILPLKQGLKHKTPQTKTWGIDSLRDTSIKTRIETCNPVQTKK